MYYSLTCGDVGGARTCAAVSAKNMGVVMYRNKP